MNKKSAKETSPKSYLSCLDGFRPRRTSRGPSPAANGSHATENCDINNFASNYLSVAPIHFNYSLQRSLCAYGALFSFDSRQDSRYQQG